MMATKGLNIVKIQAKTYATSRYSEFAIHETGPLTEIIKDCTVAAPIHWPEDTVGIAFVHHC